MENLSNSSGSFLWNDSDLRLSTSLYQWAGFELDNDASASSAKLEDLSNELTTNKNCGSGNGSLLEPLSPRIDGENPGEMVEIVREFLLEETSQFYNDVLSAQGEKCAAKTGHNVESLRKRYDTLCSQTTSILKRFNAPGVDEEVNNRLKSIDAVLGQLSPMKTPATATFSVSSSDSGRSSTDELRGTNAGPLHHWRHWIERMEGDMCRVVQWIEWSDIGELERRLKAQQALQVQIKDEGGYWVTLVQRHIDSWPSSHRREIFSASVERRWHALWIKSLEWQCRLERQIRALKLGIVDSIWEDAELGEPTAKRRRLSYDCTISELFPDRDPESVASGLARFDGTAAAVCFDEISVAVVPDTIPFLENDDEYDESSSLVLNPNSPPASGRDERISARDGGYSSGTTTCDDDTPPSGRHSASPLPPPSPPQNSPATIGLKRRRVASSTRSRGAASKGSGSNKLQGLSRLDPASVAELSEDECLASALIAHHADQTATKTPPTPSTLLSDSPPHAAAAGPPTRSTYFRRVLYRSWPIQLCLCFIVCLNLFYFYPSCCDRMNRYWWSLGPKTYYSNGPPPT